MWFDFGRNERFPTIYDEHRTPVTVDVLDAGFILAAVILAVSFYVSMLTPRLKDNIFSYSRVTVSILIGVMIMLGNFGQEWEVGHVKSVMPYKAGSGVQINGSVGIKIGLRSVNVTLVSDVDRNSSLKHEVINYNERFHWTWDQGRFGFGPFAGQLQQEFRKAQYEGVPTPILWIMEYFVIDGEGFRFGRFYRTAGWYSHILMWGAFPCWLLANIFFKSVVRYGGYCLGVAGLLQWSANLVWLVVRNPNPLIIPFEDGAIETIFGPSYWLTFSCGTICLTLSIVILILEYYFPEKLYNYFGVDLLKTADIRQIFDDNPENYQAIDNTTSKPLLAQDHMEMEMRNTPRNVEHVQRRSIQVYKSRNRNTILKKAPAADPVYYSFYNQQPSTTSASANPRLPSRNLPPPLPSRAVR
ncbi:PREDICTED: dual oxidase maturation factor 1-like [Nicrophorus vespilloides]|uniref:Dual oxidase maturation factor 1-like n=1 Tax=Nicrophorus vespilloides TaxID=110193 RepID=A0ABM1N2R4_NICVS|nr:PREDICTED: dual oxidase maturation factor 1-like [Nicrophorus vespilloides]